MSKISSPMEYGTRVNRVREFTPRYEVSPTGLDEPLDRMSFEKEQTDDIWRDDEMYDNTEDNTDYLYSKYSYDDIPLASHLAYSKTIVPNIYSDFKMDSSDEKKLNFMNLADNIVPNMFDRRLKIQTPDIREFARIAADAVDKGMPINDALRVMEKSTLKRKNSLIAIPSPDLYKVMLKTPQDRDAVVTRDLAGNEVFDTAAYEMLPLFKGMFDDDETAKQVLKECRVTTLEGNFVSPKLCQIVALMRREKGTSGYGMIEDFKFDSEKAWTKKDSMLLESLKGDDGINKKKFHTVRGILKANSGITSTELMNKI